MQKHAHMNTVVGVHDSVSSRGTILRIIIGRSLGLSWALFWLVRALLDAPVLFWARVGSPGLVWALLGSLGLVWALLGSTGFIRASLGSYGFFHGQCGHTVIMIYEGRHLVCVFDGHTDHYAPSTALHECEVSYTA